MSESLRDTIANAVEEHVPTETGVDPGQVVESTIPAEVPVEKPGRTAGRARDEAGKLLPGKPAENKGFVKPKEQEGVITATPVPAKPRPPRPSSWKKDYWEHWDKLDPSVAEYINQRESEYAKGVSTYKTEWDTVRPIAEAMAQFEPILKANNIQPAQWITNLGNAHKQLAMGTPEAKASMFLKLAHDYQIPIASLFVQGEDGKIYANPNIQPHQPPQQSQQPNVEEVVKKILLEQSTTQEIQNFVSVTDDKGQLKHPHFETVKATMQGLLQADLATDITDAYNQALKHPRHSDLYAQIQEQETRAEAERKAAESLKAVVRARGNAVSPKGSTPSVPAGEKPKGVRAAVEAAVEAHLGGGRV